MLIATVWMLVAFVCIPKIDLPSIKVCWSCWRWRRSDSATAGLLEAMTPVDFLKDTANLCHFKFCQRSLVYRRINVCGVSHMPVEILPLIHWHIERRVDGTDTMAHLCGSDQLHVFDSRTLRDAVHGVPSIDVVRWLVCTWKQVPVAVGNSALRTCFAVAQLVQRSHRVRRYQERHQVISLPALVHHLHLTEEGFLLFCQLK